MNKIELATHLQNLVNTLDEKAILESEYKTYYIVNKRPLLRLTPAQLAKRSSKEGLEFIINLYTKYQLKEGL